MTDYPTYCPAQTWPQYQYMPAEYCENEVENYGDLCARHDEDDRPDEAYDNYQESLRKEP